MTFVTAWVKNSGTKEVLWVASDSRLSFGAKWDCCPKIFPLPRGDSVLAFCGDTMYAYPILLQLIESVINYEKSLSREMDLCDLKGHFVRVMNEMKSSIYDLPRGNARGSDADDFKLLLAGWSTGLKRYKAWLLRYDTSSGSFIATGLSFRHEPGQHRRAFLFMGDEVPKALESIYRTTGSSKATHLNLEPLEILKGFVNDNSITSIGGPIQIVKVYDHINALHFNTFWPIEAPDRIAHRGRPLLEYESSKYACYDLRDMSLYSHTAAWKFLSPDQEE